MQRERARGLFVKYRECEGAFVKLRRVPKSSVACQMSRPQLFCINLLQQTSWRASFVGFFSSCMKLFPPLQVYVSIVVLTQNKIGLPPSKRYCLTPLARHDDFNDAHIKDKN